MHELRRVEDDLEAIMTDRNGSFVTLEGIDGSGKTSAVQAIRQQYKAMVQTQEPSDLWTGHQVRKAIANDSDDVHPVTTFFLFMADRNHHINERIQGALDDGMLVVSDRYSDSTLAYQAEELKGHVAYPGQFMDRCMDPWNLEPDLTIYLDISVDTAMERVDGDEEYEKRELLQAVKANYDDLATRFNDRYVRVDGEQPIEAVQEDVLEIVATHYEN